MYNRRLIITEDEKSRILNLHENKRKQEFRHFINEQAVTPEQQTQLNQVPDEATKNYFQSIYALPNGGFGAYVLKQNPSGKLLTGANGVADGNKVDVKWYLVDPKEANGTNQTWIADNGQEFNVVKKGEDFIGDSTSAAEGQTPAQAQPTFKNAPTPLNYGPVAQGTTPGGTTPGGTAPSVAEPSNTNPEATKKFQDWLDTNKPGWTTGKPYKTLDKKVERGYGKYGPLTQAAWNKYKSEYQPQQGTSGSTSGSTAGTTSGATAPTATTSGTTVAAGSGGNPLPGLNNIQDKATRDAVLAWSKTPAGQYIIKLAPEQREAGLDNLDRVRGDKETRRLKNEIRTALGMMADTGLGRLGQRVQGAVQGFKNPIPPAK